VFELGYRKATVIVSILLSLLTLSIVLRLALFRSIQDDRVSYRWYTTLYNLMLISACVSFIFGVDSTSG
jgi:formate hydrogenlyase subunit 3/multisubunit Na+/H+ antiporter MnhD subunit